MNKEEQREQWNEAWERITVTLSHKNVFYLLDEIKLEYLLPLLPPPRAKTIEVGAGSGRLSCFLASKGYETSCLDYSPNALRVAQNNYRLAGNEGNFIFGDAERLPFENNSFDVVLSTGLLEHFTNPETVINEMVRVLNPGGLFYSDIVPKKFSLLRALDPLAKLALRVMGRYKGDIYEGELSKQDIINLLKSAGLENISVFAAGVFPPRLPYSKKLVPIKFMHNLYNGFLYWLKPLFKQMDKALFAEWLGFYYFAAARKPIHNSQV